MATSVFGGVKSAVPGLDGGTFTVTAVPDNVLIVTRFQYVNSLLVQRVASNGEAVAAVSEPVSILFSGSASSGAFIPGVSLTAGAQYAWIAYGTGG